MGRARASVWFEGPTPRVLAHRGLAIGVPENTTAAFLQAIAAGSLYVETDVHATSDGVAVVSHDPDLSRVAGRDVSVRDLTIAEVRLVQLDGGYEMPTLEEALAAFPETRFNIDVKVAEAVGPTIDAVRRARAEHRVLLTSFDQRIRRRVLAGLPGVVTSASSWGVIAVVALGAVPVTPIRRRLMARALRGCGAVQVPEQQGPLRVVTRRRVRDLEAIGVETHVWTVNDPVAMRRLLALGVHGLVSDRADLALAEVRAATARAL
ncbi:glycerophosphodiester phosphodiesterase [Frigoribacterium sp. ACAM 257]|uniref:glycerophosphodiester phosphodiesterase family protein n=1 Tax=Frigoribacterium sp. ACAM 257 TaxID=2508998 RepID=UPI0011B9DB2D|nr:glycerophosphodiester phosphodiesterase family protein [Frigoribacterium sp. ACAM 257]TWX40827.1 glycerophosphodiester phosphodiesterase [Frigoribacterium sp. ACAM 257]